MYTILFFWIGLSLLIGVWGSTRQIGFGGSVVISLLLSPIGGIIFVALSPRKFKKAKL